MSDIARETNCHISVNDQPRDNVPCMTISVYAKSHSSAQHDLDIASEKIQKLLAGFMNIVDPGAKGRLMYEVALSYRGKHLPSNLLVVLQERTTPTLCQILVLT